MSDFFDNPQFEILHKDETEILDRQKHEFKLIGKQKKVPGLTLYSFNLRTAEIKIAPVERDKTVSFVSQEPLRGDRIVIEPHCIYHQSLNKKSFIKWLVKSGIIRLMFGSKNKENKEG